MIETDMPALAPTPNAVLGSNFPPIPLSQRVRSTRRRRLHVGGGTAPAAAGVPTTTASTTVSTSSGATAPALVPAQGL